MLALRQSYRGLVKATPLAHSSSLRAMSGTGNGHGGNRSDGLSGLDMGPPNSDPPESPAPDTNARHRTRLTNLLWRQRYASGELLDSDGDGIIDGIPLQSAGQRLLMDEDAAVQPTPKRMIDSYCQVVLPFASDLQLREEYVNVYRGLRLGKLMEDLDALSASIAYKHCHDGRRGYLPLTIVTASVDRMDLLNPLRPDLDLKLHGHVTYVGRSSMEVTIRIESLGDPRATDPVSDRGSKSVDNNTTWHPICLCKFSMVARDWKSNEARAVNPLILETEKQRALAARGEDHKLQKLEAAKHDLIREPPTAEERLLIHRLWLEQKTFKEHEGERPSTIVYADETKLQTVKLCHPQERNIHSSIFGGFLMREAFELAYTNARLYLKARPFTLSSDDITFRRPVPIGSILFLSSQVEYAEGEPHGTFQVSVTAEILNASYKKELTNVFHYTFARSETPDAPLRKARVRRLLPRSYGEAMSYLQGKRRKERGIALKKLQLSEFAEFPMPL